MAFQNTMHVRPNREGDNGRILHITPESAGWEYVGFDVFHLAKGREAAGSNEEREMCAVVVSGAADFEVDGRLLAKTGTRRSPFEDGAWAMYAPLGAHWRITALEQLELAICSAPARSARGPLVIKPGDIAIEKRGSGTNTRFVADLLPEDRDVADSLLVVEAFTPAGSWSSYPPHKHDEDRLPAESKLEEVYYHRIKPPGGFALQRVYTDDGSIDVCMSVKDGEVVLVPKGYHPVGAPHGYELYYLNVMAGPKRVWRTHVDPAHAWLTRK